MLRIIFSNFVDVPNFIIAMLQGAFKVDRCKKEVKLYNNNNNNNLHC